MDAINQNSCACCDAACADDLTGAGPAGANPLGTPGQTPPLCGEVALFLVEDMDCPMEEALIRNKLSGMAGIRRLDFNLMQRELVVAHDLPTAEPIEAALRSINMAPEAISAQRGSIAVFSVAGMCCPDEASLIKARLGQMPGVSGLECNLLQRTVRVHHDPAALPAIAAALDTLHMEARLLESEPDNRDTFPASAPDLLSVANANT